ncbi:HIT family protein [Nocardioides houyundeii]|uniref:HIT family protein n=1 Tax=Nocardioides houyundeii TaxID=2045452 RepID=UPI0030CD938D
MDCLFCTIASGAAPAEVVHSDAELVAFLDTRPVFKGHVLLVPRQHVVTLPDLPAPCGTVSWRSRSGWRAPWSPGSAPRARSWR